MSPARKTPVRKAPIFFRDAAAFRAWLAEHHDTQTEVMVGYYKKGATRHGITYPQALDEALCYGWIDGVVRSIDDERYAQRYTPRKKKSYWSKVNRAKAEALIAAKRMTAAGLAAWARRDDGGVDAYSHEARPDELPEEYRTRLQTNRRAWAFFEKQPPGYRRLMAHWVTSAKKEATRLSRLDLLMQRSAASERVDLLAPRRKQGARKQG